MRRIQQEEEVLLPVEVPVATTSADAERKTGIFSMLAERLMGGPEGEVPPNSIAVLPFTPLNGDDGPSFYGVALADFATRLARMPSLIVRSSSTLAVSKLPADPLETGRRLLVSHLLRGSFMRTGEEFTLNWQLLEISAGAVRSGGTISVPALDLIAIQNEISDQVFASLRGTGHLEPAAIPGPHPGGATSEEYLEARALLTSFQLHHVTARISMRPIDALVLERDPDSPPHPASNHHLQYVSRFRRHH
jgi:TolB-like protein